MSSEKSNAEEFIYIREKINQLLEVMGTFPLKPEELDDKTLIELDPIGIIAESFKQVLKHLQETNHELEFAKNEIRTIFDSINASILVIDQGKCIKDFNQNAKNNFFPGKFNGDIYNRPIDEVCGFDLSFLQQLYLNPGESHYLIKDKRNFVVRINMIGNADSEQDLSIIHLHDITEQKKVESELNQHRNNLEQLVNDRTEDYKKARDEAEKANAAKSEFLSSMSHELRTPMNAILGFAQLLALTAEELDEIQRGNVKEILDAGYHLLNLINEVLDLAKIESGKMEIHMEEVSVSDVLQQCITLIRSDMEIRQLNLIDNISSKSYIVQADFTRFKQVLLNLLSNAVKYNSDHGCITLDSEIINKQYLRINIIDTGKGLSKDNMAKLFTSFERLNVENNIEGAGIGLVISKKLIELMDGVIGVDSIPEEGSTFWFELELSHNT